MFLLISFIITTTTITTNTTTAIILTAPPSQHHHHHDHHITPAPPSLTPTLAEGLLSASPISGASQTSIYSPAQLANWRARVTDAKCAPPPSLLHRTPSVSSMASYSIFKT